MVLGYILYSPNTSSGPHDALYFNWGLAANMSLWLLAAFVPAADLCFALTYPTLASRLRGRRGLLVLPFVVPAVLTALTLGQIHPRGDPPSAYSVDESWFQFLAVSSTVLVLMGSTAAAFIFWRRARRSASPLRARRLRFMLRVVALPMATTMLGFLILVPTLIVTLGIFGLRSYDLIFYVVAPVLIGAYATIPPVGMGIGILRYRILDWDRRFRRGFRFTLSRAIIVALFVSVFFIVSQTAELFLQGRTDSTLVGVFGAAAITLVLAPLQRAARRIANRIVPPIEETKGYQAARRHNLYRAAFEEFASDRMLNDRERRLLELLARQIGLRASQQEAIEAEVLRQQGIALDSYGKRQAAGPSGAS